MEKIKNGQKLHFALIGGHFVECFDNTLYGFFAVVLAPLFFPSISPGAALLGSYGAFAAGFLARPVGAIFFGHIGDKKGRKIPLLWSMIMVGFPTIIIGLLPTYNSVGLLAPISLILCRLAQGFFMGGEFAGVNLYIAENFSPNVVGSKTGILICSGIFGAVLATLIGSAVSIELMPSWSWRIPFILGGISAFSVYLMRRKISETLDFEKVKTEKKTLIFPWKELLLNHKKSIFVSCLIAGLTIVPLYSSTILGNKIFRELGFSTSQSMLLNTIAMITDGLMVAYFGRIADRIGFHRQAVIGSLAILLIAFPAFYPIAGSDVSLASVIWFITSLVAIGCIINGCGMPYIASYFPTNCRYSGMALSVTLGHALIGGTTPLIGTYLTDVMGTKLAPAFWVAGVAAVTLLGILIVKRPTYLGQSSQKLALVDEL